MNNRTLVKVSAGEHCIGFKTISRSRKSGWEFLVTRDELSQLEHKSEVISYDLRSFAVLRRDTSAGTLSIHFSWLCGDDSKLTGWAETVVLPYELLTDFVEASTKKDGPKQWKHISVQSIVVPKIVFVDTEKLRKCLESRTVRRKLARALRDNYWGAERVMLYHDSEAYSFMFQSFRGNRPPITGGLILHNYQGDLKKAFYSVHT